MCLYTKLTLSCDYKLYLYHLHNCGTSSAGIGNRKLPTVCLELQVTDENKHTTLQYECTQPGS